MSNSNTDAMRSNEEPQAGQWFAVAAVLSGLVLIGWLYLLAMMADMLPIMDMSEAGPGMGLFNAFNIYHGLPAEARAVLAALCLPEAVATFGMPSEVWGAADTAKVFLMWLMMALAMMLPTAFPMLKAYMSHHAAGNAPHILKYSTFAAAAGYLSVWVFYAVIATGAQWILTSLQVLSPMMAPVSLVFTATILLAAGAYQFTQAKYACLTRCWYPRFHFYGSPSIKGGLREGAVQGFLCLGCCWAVMGVMFAVGIMNILWVALLGLLMGLEKALPSYWLYKGIGVFFVLWGGALAALVWVNGL